MAKCHAKRRDNEQCTQWAVRGTTVCKMHGGSAPQVRKHAASVIAAEKAAKIARRKGVQRIDDVFGELLSVAAEVKAMKDVLGDRIDRGDGDTAAYERALDRTHRVLADIARLDIEARMLKVQESILEPFVMELTGSLFHLAEALGHDPGQEATRRVIHAEIARSQRALSSPEGRRRAAIEG